MFSVIHKWRSHIIVDLFAHTINTGHNLTPLKLYQESAMGGFHDILLKVISSIRRFVDHDIWSMRRLGDYDVWLTTTYRLKFVELRRNSVENVPELILAFFFAFFLLPPI